jgi:hypothetical protein
VSARPITARTPADLLDKVYKAEGWTRAEGEVRSRRAATLYTLGRDNRRGVYVATRQEPAQ